MKRRLRRALRCWMFGLNPLVWSCMHSHSLKGEFGELCAYEKGDAKTTVYHPEANAMAERRHKEISMFCGLLGSYGVFQVKALPEARGIF